MSTTTLAPQAAGAAFAKRNWIIAAAVGLIALAFAGLASAVDLTALEAVGGPLATALTQLSELTPGMKALVGFLAFAVAFVTLAALRNMGPIMLFIGVAIFGAVGLPIAGAILGATV